MHILPLLLLLLVFGACSDSSGSLVEPPAPPTAVAQTTVTQTPGGYHIQANGRTYATFTVPALDSRPPTVTVQPVRDGWQKVTMRWNPTTPVAQDVLAVRIRLSVAGDFHWAPHLAPLPGYVMAQNVFRSPALISASGQDVIAVVPDLGLVGDLPDNPWFIDLDLPSRSMWVGMSQTVKPVPELYQTVPGMTFAPGPVELGFYVHVFQDQGAVANPFKVVRSFLWDEFAAARFGSARGIPAFDQYVVTAYGWLGGPWRDRVWQEFELGGELVGGPLYIVDATWSPSGSGVGWLQRGKPSIWNQAWFSSLRTASGMLRYGQRTRQPQLVQMAQQVRDLTLAAPQTNGLFPAVFEADAPPPAREGGAFPIDWTAANWTNSDRVPTELGITKDWYHLADMSWTALWLTRWYADLESDPQILAYVRRYADRLLQLQEPSGFFPAWLDPQTQAPARVLTDSVESALNAWFLFEFARLVPQQPQYRAAAVRALDAVLAGPVPVGRWEDFETYWSNNAFGRFTSVGIPFLRNGIFKQNTLGMYWVAAACLEAWRDTADSRYRDWGARVVDELCLWQQVWRPPFMYVPTLGGLGVMNSNTEWNDARQSLCAELFLDWSVELGDEQLWDRGVAALQASFAMMFSPLNPEASTQWLARYPFFTNLDHGFTMENYAHYEEPGPNGEGMGDFAIWTWGAGAAAQSWERIRERFGSAQFDPATGRGRSIDPLAFRSVGNRWFVDDLADHPRSVRVVVGGAEQELYVNGSVELTAETGPR